MTASHIALLVIGVIVAIFGFFFLALALREARRAFSSAAPAHALDPGSWAAFLNAFAHAVEAVTDFVKVAPSWLVAAVLGAGLVGLGAYLVVISTTV